MLQQTRNARSVSTHTTSRRRRRALARTPRGAIGSLAKDLRALDRRMGSLVETLPEPGPTFEPLSELATGLACVRSDLLADAIETLEALATLDDEALGDPTPSDEDIAFTRRMDSTCRLHRPEDRRPCCRHHHRPLRPAGREGEAAGGAEAERPGAVGLSLSHQRAPFLPDAPLLIQRGNSLR